MRREWQSERLGVPAMKAMSSWRVRSWPMLSLAVPSRAPSIRVNQQWRLIFRWDGERGEAGEIYLDDHSDR